MPVTFLTNEDKQAIDQSISRISEEIENLTGGTVTYETIIYDRNSYTIGAGFRIGTNATVDLSAPETISGWAYLLIPCVEGTVAKVTGAGGNLMLAWAMVADDGTVLNRSASNWPVLTAEEVDIYADCTLVVQTMSNDSYERSVEIRKPVKSGNVLSDVSARFATDAWFSVDEWSDGHIVTNAGAGSMVDFNVVTGSTYDHIILDCYEGMKISIAGMGGNAPRLWCFVDKNNVIYSAAEQYVSGADIVAPIDGKCIIQAELKTSVPRSVKYTPYSLKPVAEALEKLMPTFNGALVFGDGVNLKYETPEIEAMPTVTGTELLTHYYDLYDALVAAYPDYVSKVDCDAEVVAAGIARPDYMADYPIYMYKFAPAYTSDSNALDGVTQANKFKVFILSGTHPETMGIWDTYNTMRLICEQWKNDENLEALRWQCEIYVIPLSGPYGVANNSRTNYNGVDLNRNAPSNDWKLSGEGTSTYSGESAASEYETKLLVHYMEQIDPHVFIDHHNTAESSDRGCFMYISSRKQSGVDVAASHISTMSRRWKKRFNTILPDDTTTIFGFALRTKETGTRSSYGNDAGAISYTFESNYTIGYENGVLTSGAHARDAVASTVATDGFLNFLLIALRHAALRISTQVVE